MNLETILQDEGIGVDSLRPIAGWEENGVLFIEVPGAGAFELWRTLQARVPAAGFWPVLSARDFPDWLTGDEDSAPESVGAARIAALEKAGMLSFEGWLQQERDPAFKCAENLARAEHVERFPGSEGMAKLYREIAEQYRNAPPWRYDASQYPWPTDPVEVAPPSTFQTLCEVDADCKYAPAERVTLLFVPTTNDWETPAYLVFGGFNSCPSPHVHVALLEHLANRYGAQLVAMKHDTIEVLVARRPTSRDEALRLAVDLQAYTEEFVGLGFKDQSAGHVASYLMQSDRWGFWWD